MPRVLRSEPRTASRAQRRRPVLRSPQRESLRLRRRRRLLVPEAARSEASFPAFRRLFGTGQVLLYLAPR